MPMDVSQQNQEATVSPKGSGLFTDDAAARVTAAFTRAVTRARAEDALRDRMEQMESVVSSLKSRMAELERCLALTQVSVTTTSVVSESASEYSPKS
jgi:hypothetical protein